MDIKKMDSQPSAHSFRLQKIDYIQKYIEGERGHRATLSQKYNKSVRIISIVNNSLLFLTMGLSLSGIGVRSTIIAAPVAMALEGIAVGFGLVSIIESQVCKQLALKAEKHEKIKTLADAKLNTISDHISKALQDDHISDKEYSLILSELEKFNSMKEIRSKIKTDATPIGASPVGIDKEGAMKSIQNVQRKTCNLERET